jgi:hypothetical protein
MPGELANAAISTGATRFIVYQRSCGSLLSWLRLTWVDAVLHIIHLPLFPWAEKNCSIAE